MTSRLPIAAILICCACAVYATLQVNTVVGRMEPPGPFGALANWGVSRDTLFVKHPASEIEPPAGMEFVAPVVKADSTGAAFEVLLTRGHVRLGPFQFVANGQERQILGVFTKLTVFPADSTLVLIFRSLVRPKEEV